MKRPKIKLLVIEDNQLLREGIISMLKPNKEIKLIAEAGKNNNTLVKIHKLKPNVILLDIGLRSQNSLSLVEKMKKEFPEANVIVMDLVPVEADILQFVKAGASGFILKNATLDDFFTTIIAVAEGVKVLPENSEDSLFAKIVEYAISGKSKLLGAVKLTKREKEVLSLISEGMINKLIAKKLKISEYSVKSHEHNVVEKLVLRNRLAYLNFVPGIGTFKTFSESISILHK